MATLYFFKQRVNSVMISFKVILVENLKGLPFLKFMTKHFEFFVSFT